MIRELAVFLVVACALGAAHGATVTVQARVQYKHGFDLYIRGDGCGLNWDSGQKMKESRNGEHSTYVLNVQCTYPLASDSLQVKALVDDSDWQIGANTVVDLKSFLKLPGLAGSVTWTPWFYEQKGKLTYMRNLFSPQLQNSRDVVIYLPPVWTENPAAVVRQVSVMHDGNNLFAANTCDSCCPFGCWDVQELTTDPYIAMGKVESMVVIGVYNTENRTSEYTYVVDPQEGGGNGNAYLDFLEQTALPAVLKHLNSMGTQRVTPLPGRTSLIGSSLGGLISCYAGWTRPKAWPLVGCMSSSFWWDNQNFYNVELENSSISANLSVHYYLDSGDKGPGMDDRNETWSVRDKLYSDGYVAGKSVEYYLDHGGMHNEAYWGPRLWRAMTFFHAPAAYEADRRTTALSKYGRHAGIQRMDADELRHHLQSNPTSSF